MKILTLLTAFLLSQTLYAQWEKLPMPEGGDIQFMGTAHNRVWVNCSSQNYFSDDQGLHWQRWVLQDTLEFIKMWISEESLMAVGRGTSIPNLGEETIFESTDNGDHWQPVFSDTLHEFHISNAFSAGGFLFFVSSQSPGWGQFLFRSGDHGATWQNIDVGGNGTWELQLSYASLSGNIMVADMDGQDGIGSSWEYQLKSNDFGQSWQSFALPYFQGQYKVEVQKNCWFVKKRGNNYNTPLYWSLDNGNTFSQIPASPCHDKYYIVPPSTLYAYQGNATGCLYTWDATQQSWQSQSTPPDGFYFLAQTENGVLLTGHHGTAGVWRQPSPSGSWSSANSGLFNNEVYHFLTQNGHFLLRNRAQLFSSQDECQTWSGHDFSGDYYQTPFAWGDTLLTAKDNSILLSIDEGANWTLFHSLNMNSFVYPQFRDFKTYGDTLYTSFSYFYDVGILYTFDRGATWQMILNTPYSNTSYYVNDFYPFQGKIWATTQYFGDVFVSEDAGQTWDATAIHNFTGKILGEGKHLFLYGSQMYFSPDAGASWFVPAGIPDGTNISTVKKGRDGQWFGIIPQYGIYKSDDFGASWSLLDNPGYPDVFDVFPIGDSLYAHRYPQGLWRRSLTTSTVTPSTIFQPGISLIPNPAHQSVTISWPENLPNGTPFQVYDLYGRTVFQDKKQAAIQTNLDISNWPSGIYLVKAGKLISKLVKD